MRLNTTKTQHMIINQKQSGSTKAVLNHQPLEQVRKYEYLGITLTGTLDYDQQWEHVQKITNKHTYLIKQLKRIGFKEEILINVDRSVTLSQFIYSAPMLITSKTTVCGLSRE
jgi:hypothetical protein